MRSRRIILALVNALTFFLISSPGFAEGLLLPRPGGADVYDGGTLEKVGEFRLGGEDVPSLAVHPSSPIAASLTSEHGLVFWNLPQMSEASRVESPLFKKGIEALSFSPDGRKLYLLSKELRAIIVFDLGASKVAGLLPVPGAEANRLQVVEQGLLLGQKQGCSLLSESASSGLLAQYRYSGGARATWARDGRLYVSLPGQSGVWVHDLLAGHTLGLLPVEGEVLAISDRGAEKGLFLVTGSGMLEARNFQSATPQWSLPVNVAASQGLELLPGREALYLLSDGGKTLTAVGGDGQKLASTSLLEAVEGLVSFPGAAR